MNVETHRLFATTVAQSVAGADNVSTSTRRDNIFRWEGRESGDGDGNGEELDKDAIQALIEAIYDARADPTKKSQWSSMIS